jgi:hypothetical protein
MPAVVGSIFDNRGDADVHRLPLACLDGVTGVAPDGSVVWEKGFYKPNTGGRLDRIGAVSPPPGTLVGRHDPVAVNLVPVDLDEPPAYHPCDWVTAAEASEFLEIPAEIRHAGRDLDNFMGSTNLVCYYDGSALSRSVTSELIMTGAHVVDAASEFAMWTAQDDSTKVSGVGLDATCTSVPKNRDRPRLYVLLPGDRILIMTGWNGGSCDPLKQFAQAAIPRIGP